MLPLRFVSVLFLLKLVQAKSLCTEEELNEAQRAFRNCVESAKAGIVSKHANEIDENLVCDSLENMLTQCDNEVRQCDACRLNCNASNYAGCFYADKKVLSWKSFIFQK